jgi:hypothetical protein
MPPTKGARHLVSPTRAVRRLVGSPGSYGPQAYGSRKLAGEPGLDGSPTPAEPMTEDTIFDLASLTKCLATATAVMPLPNCGLDHVAQRPVRG